MDTPRPRRLKLSRTFFAPLGRVARRWPFWWLASEYTLASTEMPATPLS